MGAALFLCRGRVMASNVRTKNGSARRKLLEHVRQRAAAGEPCALCGRPIDVTLPQWFIDRDGKRKRSPWSCECDEIVPVSRWREGGYQSPQACALDRNNVQPVHRICNQKAGAKVNRSRPIKRVVYSDEDSTSRDWFASNS